jgi:hypothetical protein
MKEVAEKLNEKVEIVPVTIPKGGVAFHHQVFKASIFSI